MEGDTLRLKYSRLLTVVDYGKYRTVDIADPWREDRTLHRYILVSDTTANHLPEGTIINVPIHRAMVFTTVHASLLADLGAMKAICGMADVRYVKRQDVRRMVADKIITDLGNSMSPDIEKIIDGNPDMVLVSPFENSGGYGKLDELHIPIVECADYMEASPLGRAEWVKFFGLLFGKASQADSIFNSVEQHYTLLRDMASKVEHRPKVITETVLNGIWYVPGGKSYMAQILADAGADYPWADNNDAGSLQLDFTKVFDIAHDAEFWLVKGFGQPVTRKSITDIYELNSHFDAFKNGGIYACDTQLTSFFTDFPFHPDMLLEEYISIFHPSLLPGYNRRYFYRIEQ